MSDQVTTSERQSSFHVGAIEDFKIISIISLNTKLTQMLSQYFKDVSVEQHGLANCPAFLEK